MKTKTRAELLQAFLEENQPQGPVETDLVHSLADTSWQLSTIPALEASLLGPGDGLDMARAFMKNHRAIMKLSDLEERLHKQFHRTLKLLKTVQSRPGREKAPSTNKEPSKGLIYIN